MSSFCVDHVLRLIRYLRNRTGNRIFLASPVAVSYQGTNLNHESIFDFVGWIFSVSGDSPTGADKTNYYYPLVALYTYFCRMLCPDESYEPQMVQITWFTQGSVNRAVLGGNLDRPDRQQGQHVKNDARKRRCQKMIDVGWLTQQQMNASFVILASGSRGQKFGHCAESLPFLYIQT